MIPDPFPEVRVGNARLHYMLILEFAVSMTSYSNLIGSIQIPIEHTKRCPVSPDVLFHVLYTQCCGKDHLACKTIPRGWGVGDSIQTTEDKSPTMPVPGSRELN